MCSGSCELYIIGGETGRVMRLSVSDDGKQLTSLPDGTHLPYSSLQDAGVIEDATSTVLSLIGGRWKEDGFWHYEDHVWILDTKLNAAAWVEGPKLLQT